MRDWSLAGGLCLLTDAVDDLEVDEVRAGREGAEDKRSAAREILAIRDYPAFLRKSGYSPGE